MAAAGFGAATTPQPLAQAYWGRTSSITWREAGTNSNNSFLAKRPVWQGF